MEPLFDPLPYGDPLEFGDGLVGDLGGSIGFLIGELLEGLIGEELVSLAFTPLITLPLIFLPCINWSVTHSRDWLELIMWITKIFSKVLWLWST